MGDLVSYPFLSSSVSVVLWSDVSFSISERISVCYQRLCFKPIQVATKFQVMVVVAIVVILGSNTLHGRWGCGLESRLRH